MINHRVVIIGGGLAGLTTAVELVDRGFDVTLVEAADRFGGKLSSWRDHEEDPVEHGIHGWWPNYVNLFDLMKRVGISEKTLLTPSGTLWVMPDGSTLAMRSLRTRLPSPFFILAHFLFLFLKLPVTWIVDYFSAFRAGMAILIFDTAKDFLGLDQFTFRSWLSHMGVSQRMYEVFFEPYVRSFAFDTATRISTAATLSSFHLYMVRNQDDILARWLTDDPDSLIIEPIVDYIRQHGGRVVTGVKAEGLVLDHTGRVVGVQTSRERVVDHHVSINALAHIHEHTTSRGFLEKETGAQLLQGDYFIAAVNVEACKQLLSDRLKELETFRNIDFLGTTPVLTARLWFPGANLLGDKTSGIFVDYPLLDNFFVLSNLHESFRNKNETVIEVQAYLVEDKIELPDARLLKLILQDLRRAFPVLSMHPRKNYILRHESEFTHLVSGSDRYRPDTRTPLPNFYLAGDWVTRSSEVFNMERAVVTGKKAAAAVIENAGGVGPSILPIPSGGPLFRSVVSILRAVAAVGRLIRRIVHGGVRVSASVK